ncbi:hypothetical protein LB452_12250 [Psychroflexus sp. CAK8W]|uniref:VPEID-CTERM protein sorting domain-containing protein n=1 Tax=Psychroflexus longus TaxID=2873596 RepID=A0ABS7XLQ0_9FLAO|nr:hypothetical protein [Psychroflexus longus]MBZ9779695.1 hypothetical protein [Psychroflexus longus]
MKFNFSRFIALVSVIILLLTPKLNYAQFGDIGFEDTGGTDVDDSGAAAPINGLIAVGLVVGGYLGIRTLRK